MIIDGQKIDSNKTFDVINPYTNEIVGSVPISTPEQIEQALRFSYEAKTELGAEERAGLLEKTALVLKERKKGFAELITHESGLCIKDSLYEVDRAANAALSAAKVAETIEMDATENYVFGSKEEGAKLKVITEPLDLVAAITPFNHPLNQVVHKVFPAVAAGTCVVLKPSGKTPLSAIKLGELLLELGLEKNMFNIVTGIPASAIADQMISSPLVDMVTFTGGLEVGLHIKKKMVDSYNALKKYVAELGGCSSLIVNEDADIVKSVKVAVAGCFRNSGQRCTAIRRVIVHESIADQFCEMITEETQNIRYGNPYDIETDMGTVITDNAAKMIEKRVNDCIRDGAKLLAGNIRDGALYSPTVLDNVSINSELVSIETFGPVCPIIRARDIDEAIKMANQTNYRLAGAIMTRSKEVAEKVSNSLIVGQFNWNNMPSYRTEAAPFGGFKDSGNGEKEGVVLATQGMRRIRTFYEH